MHLESRWIQHDIGGAAVNDRGELKSTDLPAESNVQDGSSLKLSLFPSVLPTLPVRQPAGDPYGDNGSLSLPRP